MPVKQRSVRGGENIAAASASIEEDPNQYLTRRSQALGISVTFLRRVLRKDLGLHPDKLKLTQELKPLDHQNRRMLVNWTEHQLENDPDFHRKTIFSDGADFWLTGFANKQNMRYWLGSNLHVLHHHCIPKELRFGVVNGLYFFPDDQYGPVIVKGNH